ncbi:MAG: Ig-like domain-containing protein [Eubacterium sp.]|nr:Ig-like domain-containing protein [Eubacterium sp.]
MSVIIKKLRPAVVCACAFGLAVSGLSADTDALAAKKPSISKKILTMKVGQKKTLKLKNITKKQSGRVKWSSFRENVATVNKKGVVRAKSSGQTTISARYKKKTYTCKVTVKNEYTLNTSYLDSQLEKNSKAYDNGFAGVSLKLSMFTGDTAIPSGGSALEKALAEMGYDRFVFNDYYRVPTSDHSMAVSCAAKTIGEGADRFTAIVILPRSRNYGNEWVSNFTMGDGTDTPDHKGFSDSARIVSDFLNKYITDIGINGHVKFWIAGQSRGAAVGNLLAKRLADAEITLPAGISYERSDIYAYLFATPGAAYAGIGTNRQDLKTGYEFIHNVLFYSDVVPLMPPEQLGFGIYGQILRPDESSEKKEDMLALLKDGYPNVYTIYEGMDTGGHTAEEDLTKAREITSQMAELVGDRKEFDAKWKNIYLYAVSKFLTPIDGLPALTADESMRMISLLAVIGTDAGDMISLLKDHHPEVEFAWLCVQ